MPQSERSAIIKEFLKWMQARCRNNNGPTIQECVRFITLEVTEMGATTKRAKGYVESCARAGLIHTKGIRFVISKDGENWLKRKSLI